MQERVKIKFIPTGFEFNVEKNYADELLKEESENFIAVDGYTPPETPAEPTIYESIVVEEKEEKEVTIPKRRRNRD
jgi:hypothetical protein